MSESREGSIQGAPDASGASGRTDRSEERAEGDVFVGDVIVEDVLVEDVSIDGMCGVY